MGKGRVVTKTGDDARERSREEEKEEKQTAEQPLLQIITSCHSNGGEQSHRHVLPPCESLSNARFLGPQSLYLKRRLDRFSRVCRAHGRNQQTHEHTHTQTTQLRSNSPH